MRTIAAVTAAVVLASPAFAQEAPKPGPEHEVLKRMVGNWDAIMNFGGMESKATATFKMDLGGLWLVSSLEGDFGGEKFSGRGLDSYDAAKKKYVSVWVDSMSTAPMVMEGDYDKATKTLTLVGDYPGPDGKPAKWRSASTLKDENTIQMSMFINDAKEPMFTVTYKRKK